MINNLKFFDVNCMIGNWYHKLEFSDINNLHKHMSKLQIDRAIVFHSLSWQFDPFVGNTKLVKEISGNSMFDPAFVLLPFATNEMSHDTIKRNMEIFGVKMIRLFPKDHYFKLADWNSHELLSFLEKLKMPIMINFDQVLPEDLLKVCKEYPNLPIILSNVAGELISRMIYSLFIHTDNLFLETSTYLIYGAIEDLVKKFGNERILFGTRMPFFDPGCAVAKIIYANITTADKEKIAFTN
jgi:predicted TIM-barrel fold metal-dependent hydrolase